MNSIEREKLAVKVLTTARNYSAVHWSVDNLMSFLCVERWKIIESAAWITKKHYATGMGPFYITKEGDEYLDGLAENVDVVTPQSENGFKDEALTGLSEGRSPRSGYIVSKRSKLRSAVVPRCNGSHESQTPEELIEKKDAVLKSKMQLAKRLRMTLPELESAILHGVVRKCKLCGKVEIHHKKGAGRVQPVCRKCRCRKD